MSKIKKVKIIILSAGKKYSSGFGGEYKGRLGINFLTHTQAQTLWIMKEMSSARDQFRFYSFAYLRELICREGIIRDNRLLNVYERLVQRYGLPWDGNAKHILPTAGQDFWRMPGDIINTKHLLKIYNNFARQTYILYPFESLLKNTSTSFVRGSKGEHNNAFDFSVGNYQIYSSVAHPGAPAFAISNYASEELRRRLSAAALSVAIGTRSIDSVLKRYSYSWPLFGRIDREQKSLFQLLVRLNNILEDFFIARGYNVERENECLGMIASEASLARCGGTFHAIFCLLGNGHFVEALILARHVLEQVAWSGAISRMDTIHEIEATKPQKEIKFIRYHKFGGLLYGTLSEYCHLSARRRNEYVRIHDNKPSVICRSTKHALRLIPLIILTLDIYISGYEKICFGDLKKSQSWKKRKNGKWVLDCNRRLAILWSKHKGKLFSPKLLHELVMNI